jgi:oligosaccharide repeat unit polymerase
MIWVSIREHHLAIVSGFLDTASSQIAKSEYRLQHAGSNNYAYRVIVNSIAPFFVIWGILESLINRFRILLAVSLVLLLLTLFGRVETLSKAPVALLFVQIGLAALLCFGNRAKWQVLAGASTAIIVIFYPLIELTIPETARQGTAIEFFFWRTLFIPNEVLLEYFNAIPYYLPHTWGANIRPVALLLNMEFRPTYDDVSLLWHGKPGSTSNSMFIADAWADFSFVGVAVASILAGAVCRFIDVAFVTRGKSTTTIAILACTFVGIVHLMIGSIQSAMLSGGLASVPLMLLSILKLSNLFRGCRGAIGRVPMLPAPNQTGDSVSGMTDK